MITITNALVAVIVAGMFFQLFAVVRVGGKVLAPRIARRRKVRVARPAEAAHALAMNVRARRRLRRDYRIALLASRVG